jgi:predicted dehydrogenase
MVARIYDGDYTGMTGNTMTRRAAALTALSYSRVLGANERVRVGYIGVGNRGDQVHDAFLEWGDQETAAVCDLRDDYMDFAVKKSRATPKKYNEWQRLLEDKSVDAVMIATPDHWHALQMVAACQAGKDVYVEKPMSLTVTEGRRMVQVAEQTKRVVQVGIHRRSSKFLQEAAQLVRDGAIGKVTVAKGWHLTNEYPNGLGDGKNPPRVPNEKEWDQWLGPAPKVPFNKNRMYYNFRWFYDYSGGQVTNMGVHYVDFLRSAIGKDSPRAVTAMGGVYAVGDNREIPDTLEALWDFDGTLVVFSQYNANSAPGNAMGAEMELRGTKGTMYVFGNRYEIVPEKTTEMLLGNRTPLDRVTERSYGPSKQNAMEPVKSAQGSQDTRFHTRNFLDCVKSRAKCNCDPLTGHYSTTATLLGNIALRTKSHLQWDAKAERFIGNEAANQLLSYKYRAPYKLG